MSRSINFRDPDSSDDDGDDNTGADLKWLAAGEFFGDGSDRKIEKDKDDIVAAYESN